MEIYNINIKNDIIKKMETNINIPKKEIAPGVFTTGGVATIPTVNPISTQSNIITPNALQPTTAINVTAPLDTSIPTVEGDMSFYNNLQNQQSIQEQQLLAEKASGTSDLSKLLTDFTGQGNEQLALEQKYVNPLQAQITDVTGQLGTQLAEYKGLQTEFEKMSADIEAGAGKKGLTTGAVMGQQGAVDRAKLARLNSKASEIAITQASVLALQGKADLAQKQVDRAVDLKYKGIEQEINIKKFQLENIKENLTAEQKKRWDAQQYALGKEEKRIAEKKEQEKTIEKMLLDATPNAPANIIANAKAVKDKGGSTLEVAQALGIYGGDYLKTELLKQQIETEKAQRSNYNANAEKTRAETGLLRQPVGLDGVIATLPKSSQERYYKLQGDFDTATKNYRGAIDSANSITALSKDATPQQQTAMIFQYMKTLDPSSTVREGEFALVGKTAGLGDRAVNALKRLDNGSRLNESQINDIVGASKVLAENAKKNLELTSNEYDRRAVKFGLPKGLFYEKQDIQTTSPEAEALREKLRLANPSLVNTKFEGTDIISNVSNGIIDFKLPTNPTKR